MRYDWLDGMMGLIVGDALGVPVQFMRRAQIQNRANGPVIGMESGGVYDMPKGTWSDDSSMALATMIAIMDDGELLPDTVMNNFVAWKEQGEFTPFGQEFDIGNTCSKAIRMYETYHDTNNCGETGEYANGNGALMRILPACLYYYHKQCEKIDVAKEDITKEDITKEDITKEAIEGVEYISALTHNHKRSKIACGIYYFMIKEILDAKEKYKNESKNNSEIDTKAGVKVDSPKHSLIELLQRGINAAVTFYQADENALRDLDYYKRLFDLNEFKNVAEPDISSSGYVVDSLEAAVWALIKTSSLKDALLLTVNLGDDSDTVAAIAGGLAGLYYGYNSIPIEWLEEIQKRQWIEGLCMKMN